MSVFSVCFGFQQDAPERTGGERLREAEKGKRSVSQSVSQSFVRSIDPSVRVFIFSIWKTGDVIPLYSFYFLLV